MSIQAVAWALEQDLPARPKLVLVSIANHADHTTGYCWLKADTIAGEAACTPRSVYRFIGGLVRNGYIRKAPKRGDDGKQRANDYWILFAREETRWDWGAVLADDDVEADADTDDAALSADGEAAPDVVKPHEGISHGETPQPTDTTVLRQGEITHAVSHGPADNGVSRYDSDEPSKTKPLESRVAPARPPTIPRSYKPPPEPPPTPQGAMKDNLNAKSIFVFEGSRAYEAWAKVKSRTMGISNWNLTTTHNVDGQTKRGWWFPTLFPPDTPTAGPPKPNEEIVQFTK